MSDPKYDTVFSVEEVNRLVLRGVPFREAYRQVGTAIEKGTFKADRNIDHTHEGSIGNLCNDKIRERMEHIMAGFPFARTDAAIAKLIAR
jgi:argininosuccinate lyase